jgi:predicted amidohydrolase
MVSAKRLLPELRRLLRGAVFLPGPPASPVTIAGRRVGVLICEDLWDNGYDVHPPADCWPRGGTAHRPLSVAVRRGVLRSGSP